MIAIGASDRDQLVTSGPDQCELAGKSRIGDPPYAHHQPRASKAQPNADQKSSRATLMRPVRRRIWIRRMDTPPLSLGHGMRP